MPHAGGAASATIAVLEIVLKNPCFRHPRCQPAFAWPPSDPGLTCWYTSTVTRYVPANAYVCMPATENVPSPLAVTIPIDRVPSPHDTIVVNALGSVDA